VLASLFPTYVLLSLSFSLSLSHTVSYTYFPLYTTGLAIALAFAATALLILAAVYIYRNADFTAPHVETSSTSSSTPEKHAIEPKEISAEAAIVFENGHESEPEISAEIVMDTVEVIDRDIYMGVA